MLFLRFRDLNQIWDMTTQAGFFLAPIVYPLGVIPERYHLYLYLWPPTPAIEFSRLAMVEGVLPSPMAHACLGLMAAGHPGRGRHAVRPVRTTRGGVRLMARTVVEVNAVSKSFEIPSVHRETLREHLFGVLRAPEVRAIAGARSGQLRAARG